uniref:hypothetical protein n=1 Tax=Xanthomonas oryzae TaxID=347 RepID=UPI003D9FD4F8
MNLVRFCLGDDADRLRMAKKTWMTFSWSSQRVIFLSRTGGGEIHWLSDHGKLFPAPSGSSFTRPRYAFISVLSVCHWISRTTGCLSARDSFARCYLNYDNLLYQPMIESQVLSGYSGALVDGFLEAGFAEKNLNGNSAEFSVINASARFRRFSFDRGSQVVKLKQPTLATMTISPDRISF